MKVLKKRFGGHVSITTEELFQLKFKMNVELIGELENFRSPLNC